MALNADTMSYDWLGYNAYIPTFTFPKFRLWGLLVIISSGRE